MVVRSADSVGIVVCEVHTNLKRDSDGETQRDGDEDGRIPRVDAEKEELADGDTPPEKDGGDGQAERRGSCRPDPVTEACLPDMTT